MKKFLLLSLFFTGLLIQAQTKGKVRVDFNLGYAIPQAGGGGLALSLEPKYNIADNMSVGLRFGTALLVKEVNVNESEETAEGEIGGNGSYLGTFEYNFNKGNSSFAPFVGAGVGYYSIANIGFDSNTDPDTSSEELEASGKFGGMVRAGFDWGKFRLGLEYNIVPESDLKDFNNETIGSTKNSYLGISLGFFLGGGKWGK
ncbi:hypothetical protein [Aquimarina agarivorans]|uniref:hypothetical protein n=1 Tax=Aquimarina agarivorans TaxID=980584 RepID=UPI000248FCCE|nr:hypothetical protein [Aquimarina agarivorans]